MSESKRREGVCARVGIAFLLAATATIGSASPAVAMPATLAEAVAATDLTPDEFLAAFDDGELSGLAEVGPAPAIYGTGLDARIRTIGEGRGYRRRPEPSRDLVQADGIRLQPEAAEAWESLQGSAAAAGHSLSVTSGFRSVSTQIWIFNRKLTGTSDAAIDQRLRTVAVPGYSKHHTGYAIDVRSSTGRGFAFRDTAAFAWLSDNNFANAKAHGWVPSYPEGSSPAGPVPEPWELVWVGAINIICADFDAADGDTFCDSGWSSFSDDIDWLHSTGVTYGCRAARFCTDTPITRGQFATMLWRLMGTPVATSTEQFDDVEPGRYDSEAVYWMVEQGITSGTSPTMFEPDRLLTREELATFLWRTADRPAAAGTAAFDDVDPGGFSGAAVAWAAGERITNGTSATEFTPRRSATRGETAVFLHRFSGLIPT